MKSMRFIRPRPIGLTLLPTYESGTKSGFRYPCHGVWNYQVVGGGGGGASLWVAPSTDAGAGSPGSYVNETAYIREMAAGVTPAHGAGGDSGNSSDYDLLAGKPGATTTFWPSSAGGGSGGSLGGNPVEAPSQFPQPPYNSYGGTLESFRFYGVGPVSNGVYSAGRGGSGRSQSSGQGNGSGGYNGGIMIVLRG